MLRQSLESGGTLEEAQLFFIRESVDRMGSSGVAIVIIMDAMLAAQTRHQLREPLAIRGREEGTLLVALAVACDQVREFLFEKGKKH